MAFSLLANFSLFRNSATASCWQIGGLTFAILCGLGPPKSTTVSEKMYWGHCSNVNCSYMTYRQWQMKGTFISIQHVWCYITVWNKLLKQKTAARGLPEWGKRTVHDIITLLNEYDWNVQNTTQNKIKTYKEMIYKWPCNLEIFHQSKIYIFLCKHMLISKI